MKKNSKPELTQSWWNSNKPKAWSDGRLEMALAAYVKGLLRLEREKSQEALEAASDLLDQVEKHAEASEKIAGEKPRKEPKDYDAEDFNNTAEALKKFGSCIKLERKRLEDLVEEEEEVDKEDEEDDKGLLLDEEAYKKYLKKMMKRLQSKSYVFALALSKPSAPEEHRFLFHKSKEGKILGKQIVDEVEGLEMKKITWGVAGADPQVSSTLVLVLEHKQLPGMVKQGNKFLKAFKPLPFDTIKLVSAETGEALQDLPDPEDTEADKAATPTGTATEPSTPSPEEKPDLLAQLNALIPRIKEFAAAADVAGQKAGADLEAKKAILAPRNRLLTLVRDCKGMIGTNDEQAEAMLADIESILDGGQVEIATSTPSPKEKPDLLARLNALIPRIKEFAAAADVAGQKAGADLEAKKTALAPKNRLLTLVRDCKGIIGTNDEQAEAMLADIESILKSSPVIASERSTTASSTGGSDTDEAKFKLRATEIKKQFDQLKASDPVRAQPIAGLLMQAFNLGKAQQFADAMLRLDRIVEMMKPSTMGDSSDSSTEDEQRTTTTPTEAGSVEEKTTDAADFELEMKGLEPKLLEAQKADPDARTSLGNLWSFAVDQIASGNADGAKKAIERLTNAIDVSLANKGKSDTERFGIREGFVAEQRAALEKFFIDRMAAAEASTESRISSIEKAISAQVPDEAPEFLASAIQNALDEKYERVSEELYAPIDSETSTMDGIVSLVEKLRTEVAGDPLMRVLKKAKSQLGVDADVSSDFEELFDDFLAKAKGILVN